MKVIIFGASGSVGSQLVKQALDQGHQVTAFARQPSALKLDHPNLHRHAGDVTDAHAVIAAVTGHDAVMVTLGAGRQGGVRAVGTRNIVSAMQHQGIRRLICMSSLGVGDSHRLLNFFWKHIMFGLLLKKAMADHEAQEAIVRAAGDALDWVIVRPGAFTDGPATDAYQHGAALANRPLKLKISRADIADFMLKQLTSNAYLRLSPGISY